MLTEIKKKKTKADDISIGFHFYKTLRGSR